MTTPALPPQPPPPVARAVATVLERVLVRGTALFAGGGRVWTRPVLADLHARLTSQSPTPGDTFDEQWATQLRGAPDPTLQLAAELMFVHLLYPTDLSPRTKRTLVGAPLSWAERPARVPDALDAALESGIARTGIAYKARRQSQLRLLLETVIAFRAAPPPRRDVLLRDPWAWKAWLWELPHEGADATRQVLLHLVHPATFEPMVSTRVKEQVTRAFAAEVGDELTDVDRALADIRAALRPEHGDQFAFVDDAVAARWRDQPSRTRVSGR